MSSFIDLGNALRKNEPMNHSKSSLEGTCRRELSMKLSRINITKTGYERENFTMKDRLSGRIISFFYDCNDSFYLDTR